MKNYNTLFKRRGPHPIQKTFPGIHKSADLRRCASEIPGSLWPNKTVLFLELARSAVSLKYSTISYIRFKKTKETQNKMELKLPIFRSTSGPNLVVWVPPQGPNKLIRHIHTKEFDDVLGIWISATKLTSPNIQLEQFGLHLLAINILCEDAVVFF